MRAEERGITAIEMLGVIRVSQVVRQKNAGLKAATLISVSNPVSQVLW
jgi:hypothetical protein